MRGSVGSARVWDERTRAQRAGAGAPAPAELPGAETARVLAPDELSAWVAGIVQVTLDTRLPECDPLRRRVLARELQLRLLSLFLETPFSEATPGHGVGPAAPETKVEPEFAPAASKAPEPDALEARVLAPEPRSSAARALGLVLEDRLNGLGGTLTERADLRQRLIALAQTALDAPSSPAGSEASSEELRSLDVLQRRAHKLARSLQDARAALEYVAGLAHVDQGLTSIYRTVQGLASSDPHHTQKRDVLEGVFRANMALQKPGWRGS